MDDNKVPVTLAERVFIIFVLLLSTGAFLNLEVGHVDNPETGNAGWQVVWIGIYLISALFVWNRSKNLGRILNREFWLLSIVVLAVGSTFWSDDPFLTARRGIALICTTLFGVYLADRFSLKQQLRLLAITFSIAALLSLIFQLLGLGKAVDDASGWIGIYTQKNSLGLIMAFGSAVLLLVRGFDEIYGKWATVGAMFCILLLLLSQSMTAIIMFAVLMIMFPLCRALRKSYRVLVGLAAVAIPLLVYFGNWVFENLDVVTEFIGKDVTLTGRVELWILSFVMASQHPWLGYGYEAFWRGGEGPSSAIWHLLSWDPPHSHNGYLEIWLALGFTGLALFMIGFLSYVRRAIHHLRATSGFEGCWPLIFLVLTFLSNLTGVNFLSRNSIFWIMYVAVGVTTASIREQESSEPAPSKSSFYSRAHIGSPMRPLNP